MSYLSTTQQNNWNTLDFFFFPADTPNEQSVRLTVKKATSVMFHSKKLSGSLHLHQRVAQTKLGQAYLPECLAKLQHLNAD